MNLSKIIKEVMKELNISGAELAKRSNQSPQNLSKKLNKETLSYEEFQQLMELMGASVDLSYKLPGSEEETQAFDRHATEQLNILEKELEVERLKNKYFMDMSYEVRTALSTIDGGVELAINHREDPRKVAEFLSKAKPAVQTLKRLVEDNPFNRVAGISQVKDDFVNSKILQDKHVLLVEDNVLNREIVREVLEDSRMIVSEAENGKEAVSMVGEETYDFVLMDLQMPVMDGFKACEEIRKLTNQKRAKTLVYAMTASVTEEDRTKAIAAGMNGFIEKPLDLKKLSRAILG